MHSDSCHITKHTAPILPSPLQAHCVLEILPAALADSGTALSATVTLTPGLPLKPGVIGTVWEGVQQHATSSKGECSSVTVVVLPNHMCLSLTSSFL